MGAVVGMGTVRTTEAGWLAATTPVPDKTIRELHELARSGSGIDLLKDFSEVAREESRAFTTL
jgi:hypothetical protein